MNEIKSTHLKGTDRCTVRRQHSGLHFEKEKKEYFETIKNTLEIIKDGLFKRNGFSASMDRMDFFRLLIEKNDESFKERTFQNEITKEIFKKEQLRKLSRFLIWEKRKAAEAPTMTVNCFEQKVSVSPTYLCITNHEICVCKVCDKKPDVTQNGAGKDNSARRSLELYAFLKYGEKLIPAGKSCVVKAQYLFLKRKDDSTRKFNLVFTGKGAGNVITLSETAVIDTSGKKVPNDMDELFEPQFKEFKKGEVCSEAQCKECDFYTVCNYQHIEKRPEKERRQKTLTELTDELTDEQVKVVNFRKGIARVNAVPGSGKTTVATIRIPFMLSEGIKPEEIVCWTFTNNAAKEFKERVENFCDDLGLDVDLNQMFIGTFDKFSLECVRKYHTMLGYKNPPDVIDDITEQSRILNDLLCTHEKLPGFDYRNYKLNFANSKGAIRTLGKCFELIKREGFTLKESDELSRLLYKSGYINCYSKKAFPEVFKMYEEYNDILVQRCLVEYGDLTALFNRIIESDPYFTDNFKFRHLVVDEFQDVNKNQVNLIKEFMDTKYFESLLVIGDVDQSIYEFRGAKPEIMVNLSQELGRETTDLNITENHRSGKKINDLANEIISKNKMRVKKEITSAKDGGDVIIKDFKNKKDEYAYIAKSVKEQIEEGEKPEDIAVIAHNKAELVAISDALTMEGVKWCMLTAEPVIKDSKVAAAVALSKVYKDVSDTEDAFIYLNALTDNTLLNRRTDEEIEKMIEAFTVSVQKEVESSTIEEQQLKYISKIKKLDINETDELFSQCVKKFEKQKDILSLFDYMNDFEDYGEDIVFNKTGEYPGTALVTAHGAKGLEWKAVYIATDGFNRSYSESEEGRRLFFVSITRAKEQLCITGQRWIGKRGVTNIPLSEAEEAATRLSFETGEVLALA